MANKLATEKKVLAISMLCEGSSFRAIERVTGVHRDPTSVTSRKPPAGIAPLKWSRSGRAPLAEPDFDEISTSHIEKQNHTLRMHCRRLTRLTNAFSKKLDNFQAAVSLNFGYYNLCRRHIAIKTTSATTAGIEDHEWMLSELVETCGE